MTSFLFHTTWQKTSYFCVSKPLVPQHIISWLIKYTLAPHIGITSPLNSYTSLFIPSVSWINKQAFIYSGYITLNWITKSLEGLTRNYCRYQRANCLIMHFMCLISTNKILIFMGKMSSMRDNTIFVKARYIFAKERAFDHNFSMCCCLLTVPSCCLWHSALTIQKRPVL